MRVFRLILVAVIVTTAVVLPAAPASAGPLQDDLKVRRARAMERLGPGAMAILWSAPERVFSTDVNYEYRQDSNLLYLTGLDQEETVLVLMPGNETRKEILFVREADPRREHWDGHTLTPAEATAASGIEAVMTIREFEPFIAAMFSKRAPAGAATEYAAFFQALTDGGARLSLVLEPHATLSGAARGRHPVRLGSERPVLRLHRSGRHARVRRPAADHRAYPSARAEIQEHRDSD